jgi:hypothetical protein
MLKIRELRERYRLRLKRKRLLWRAFRKRGQLALVSKKPEIPQGAILACAVMRNEAVRLPYFLEHYRALGVDHFLIVDNGSEDGSAEILAAQPDVTLWSTRSSYRLSRFGVDWITWLLIQYGEGHWCLTVDADEILIYPFHETRPLQALTGWLEARGQIAFPAMMLDLYPKGPVSGALYQAGQDPFEILQYFDSGNYTIRRQKKLKSLWIQGGPRARTFFTDRPRRAPTLSKIPLVKWSRGFAYLNSTHSLLPPHLNQTYDRTGGEAISGVLLHTKFLHTIVEKSAEEKRRREHFGAPEDFDGYYDRLIADPDLSHPHSARLTGWRGLEARGLMSRGGWI